MVTPLILFKKGISGWDPIQFDDTFLQILYKFYYYDYTEDD